MLKKEQIQKLLKVGIITTIIILVFEIVFSLNIVIDFFNNLITSSGNWAFVLIWFIMFLQVTILNIPAYVVLSACVSIGIQTLSLKYILIVLSAYMCGCILAYWLGRWFGVKALRWCAGSEEDYLKWSSVINKKGKWWYFLTVLFPLFPDDILCIVCGASKLHFGFYAVCNIVGRCLGLVSMLLFLKFIGSFSGGFPFMITVWAMALIGELIAYFIIKRSKKNESNINR